MMLESIKISTMDRDKVYFNPGCAMVVQKQDSGEKILALLNTYFSPVKLHDICCHHDPKLPSGSIIINNCAGCDRRFRSLYPGISTISLWEILDSIDALPLPDYHGTNSICCGDNFYPALPIERVNELQKKRASQMPCADVAVYCASCIKSMYIGGKRPHHMVDLVLGESTEKNTCQTDIWHEQIDSYIMIH